MSVYARVERYGSKTMLLYLRGVSNTVGENTAGILSTSDIVRPFFLIHAVNDCYVLAADNLRLRVNGELFEPLAQRRLCSGDEIVCADYKFHIAITSPLAEALARSDLPASTLLDIAPNATTLATITLRLASLSRTFPLVPDAHLSVGRNRAVGIPVDLEGIAAEHGVFSIVQNQVIVTPRNGKISVDNIAVTSATVVPNGGVVRLLPLGVALTVTYSGATAA